MEDTVTSERLKNLIARFVLQYNYWGYLFSRVRRKADKNLPSIMGVGPEQDGTICLYYNPPLVDKTDDQNLLKVIEHEGMHVLNKHISRLIRVLANETSDTGKYIKSRIWNIASDCTVNDQAKLKDDLLIAGRKWPLHTAEKHKLPPNQITETYFLELLKREGKNLQKFVDDLDAACKNGDGLVAGDHSKWMENCKGVADLSSLSRKIDQHVRNLIKESAKTFSKERGNLPSHIAELIQGALLPPQVPYYQVIRKLVRGSRFSKFMSSPTRINRKRTYTFVLDGNDAIPKISPFPGKKRDFTFDVVVLIDTSGSMSMDDIKEGLSGVKNIIEKDRYCRTTVLEVDAGVEKEYTCKKIRDIQFNVKGRGGTTLGPGLFRAKQLNCDVCLAFTDGYTENINNYPRKKLPKKTIWVITKGGSTASVNQTGFVIKL